MRLVLAACLCFALAYKLDTSRPLRERQHTRPSDAARELSQHAHTVHRGATDTRRGARHSGTLQRQKEFRPPEHVHYLERCPSPERPGSRKPQVFLGGKPVSVFYPHNRMVVPEWGGWVRAKLQPIP